MDCLDPLIARVSRRAGGFSNLTTESAEDLQVTTTTTPLLLLLLQNFMSIIKSSINT